MSINKPYITFTDVLRTTVGIMLLRVMHDYTKIFQCLFPKPLTRLGGKIRNATFHSTWNVLGMVS